MNLYEEILERKTKIAVIGLGYVGLPISIAFANKAQVIGYDANDEKVELYKNGIDLTNEVGNDLVKESCIVFTSDAKRLADAKFHIIAVPTPVNENNMPDLNSIQNASRTLGKHMVKDSIIVYESTVYPGVTEDICVPILEKESGLKCGRDFSVGYSPERINPGDKKHRLDTIVKVVSGMDEETLDIIAKVYEIVAKAGVYRAESIKVAEAAKVIENSQRDINIAFMNELSMIFHRLGIDTKQVLKAAATKWNFLDFSPGLVGGHCIGVDPYYLTYKSEEIGYHSQVILSGRRINDSMGRYVAEHLVKSLIRNDIVVKRARVAILGFTFKENCPDTRNTKVFDIYKELLEYGIQADIVDSWANADEVRRIYGIDLKPAGELSKQDAVVIAVPHREFFSLDEKKIEDLYDRCNKTKILFDLKGVFEGREPKAPSFDYWRL